MRPVFFTPHIMLTLLLACSGHTDVHVYLCWGTGVRFQLWFTFIDQTLTGVQTLSGALRVIDGRIMHTATEWPEMFLILWWARILISSFAQLAGVHDVYCMWVFIKISQIYMSNKTMIKNSYLRLCFHISGVTPATALCLITSGY